MTTSYPHPQKSHGETPARQECKQAVDLTRGREATLNEINTQRWKDENMNVEEIRSRHAPIKAYIAVNARRQRIIHATRIPTYKVQNDAETRVEIQSHSLAITRCSQWERF